jgi:hypothetical protein
MEKLRRVGYRLPIVAFASASLVVGAGVEATTAHAESEDTSVSASTPNQQIHEVLQQLATDQPSVAAAEPVESVKPEVVEPEQSIAPPCPTDELDTSTNEAKKSLHSALQKLAITQSGGEIESGEAITDDADDSEEDEAGDSVDSAPAVETPSQYPMNNCEPSEPEPLPSVRVGDTPSRGELDPEEITQPTEEPEEFVDDDDTAEHTKA